MCGRVRNFERGTGRADPEVVSAVGPSLELECDSVSRHWVVGDFPN